jgi:acetylglutamate kinase
MADMQTIVVKIGGKAAEKTELLRGLFREMKELSGTYRFLLVHGGGAEVTAVSKKFGIQAVFKDGVRQTTPEEMDIVDMVLSGRINKQLVRLCRACGLDAVGLSGSDGGIFLGRARGKSRTGDIATVAPRLLSTLLEAGFLPVVSSTSMDAAGTALNINADAAAFALASRLRAEVLLFFSDIPGVLRDGVAIPRLDAGEAQKLIADGVVTGGMIPKVSASLEALGEGVGRVVIGEYETEGTLMDFLSDKRGTAIAS